MGASKPKGNSNKKQVEKKKGGNPTKSDKTSDSSKSSESTKSGNEEPKRKEYQKALQILKLEWFKYVDAHVEKVVTIWCMCILMHCRSGVVSADELDSDTMDSVDFLMAKLKQIQSQKVHLNPGCICVDVTIIT